MSTVAHPHKNLKNQAISLTRAEHWETARLWMKARSFKFIGSYHWSQWAQIFTFQIEVIASTSSSCLCHLFYRERMQWNKFSITNNIKIVFGQVILW